MPRVFFRLDPRIAGALRSQRRTIVQGLVCVGIGALLTAATIPLTERAVRAITEAAPIKVSGSQTAAIEDQLAKDLGVRTSDVQTALRASPLDLRNAFGDPDALARALGKPPEDVRRAIERLQPEQAETADQAKSRQDTALIQLGWICLAVVGVFGLKYFATRGQSFFLSKAASRLAGDLRIQMYAKLQRLPVRYFTAKRSGSIQSVLTNDVSVYQNAVNLIRDSIDGPFKAVGALITIFIIQWQLALVAILFIPVLAWFVQRNGRKMRDDQTRVQEDLSVLAGVTNESLGGIRVIKAFSAETRMGQLYNNLVEKTFQSQIRAARRYAQLRPMVELAGALSLATILYICGHMARAGQLHVSQIVALTFALDMINQGAKALSNVNNTYNQVQAAANRIYSEILDVPEEVDLGGGRQLENPRGHIVFENVGFTYPDGTAALQGVSFEIAPGTSLALVGPSGAGKSTLADLLLRFYDPTEGRILFDGVDIRELDLAWLRAQFGVVPQQTFLFAGTIEENLKLGRSEATPEEIARATRLAHVTPFVERSPEGLQTVLGERGAKVSGGEAQRLAIARAILREPKVLLLDEATSNLDAESERAVTEALDEVMKDRTTLFIAHRLTTAMRASRILVLRRGEVVEQGAPDELVERNGAFAGMWRAFNNGLIEEQIG